MTKFLKEKKGMTVNHNTVNTDLKKDLESLTKQEYANQKTGILAMLDDEIKIAHTMVTTSKEDAIKLKAMSAVTKLSKTKADVLIKFRKAQAELTKEERPVYNVYIGEPKIAKGDELDEKDTTEDETISSGE